MDHRVHRRLHPLTTTQSRRNPLRSEQDAFVLLVWVIGIALVVAITGRFVGIELALPLLAAGLLAVARFYFGAGAGAGAGRRGATGGGGRKARPYRGPSTKRARADAARAERAKRAEPGD